LQRDDEMDLQRAWREMDMMVLKQAWREFKE
jgi:hypothetical protein